METAELGNTSQICQKSFDALMRWFFRRIHVVVHCKIVDGWMDGWMTSKNGAPWLDVEIFYPNLVRQKHNNHSWQQTEAKKTKSCRTRFDGNCSWCTSYHLLETPAKTQSGIWVDILKSFLILPLFWGFEAILGPNILVLIVKTCLLIWNTSINPLWKPLEEVA